MTPMDRRQFLAATGAGVAATVVGARDAAAAPRGVSSFATDPFAMGVASGDPTSTSVVLWTRLAPDPVSPPTFGMGSSGDVSVHWRLASSEGDATSDATSLMTGDTVARKSTAWSVHVDVQPSGAALAPGTTYYYQFTVPGWKSPVGRTRTAPAPGADVALRFAVVSCQNAAGSDVAGAANPMYFNGLSHLITRDDIDFVLYLGDYIYEFGRQAHIPPSTCTTLADYRTRYGQYRQRSSLAEMHRLFPVYAAPDDHEFFNNVTGGALASADVDRFNAALVALCENMPVRGALPTVPTDGSQAGFVFHRSVRWGTNLDLYLVDNRQYRTGATILGTPSRTTQKQWLLDGIGASSATWTAIASGVPMAWFGSGFGGSEDKWTGFNTDRSDVTAALSSRIAADPTRFNPVVVSGDVHCGIVTHVRKAENATSQLVATEFVGPPMTSGGTTAFQPSMDPGALKKAFNKGSGGGWESWKGYLTCRVTSSVWNAEFILGDEVDKPGGSVSSFGTWQVTAGQPVGNVSKI